ncbi:MULTISPECIES: trypsin-like peptidase domain-containing protein [Pseudomonas]|uniref:trypsin-like peptidase domain-containing protein n=1 Tax=Pseudomonas TaxID=286 RepID=UPI001463158D|nr:MULTISPECIES: trypsin-like peptidase domain-containing protein [unclassified Pseudomonas]QJI20408.1 hypothetical protein HKK57_19720 [Pseudomonas sp. ADAK21]QJI24438.1 hypothetical protein HKK56_13370 [Pseudomonas sp. ADAK20]
MPDLDKQEYFGGMSRIQLELMASYVEPFINAITLIERNDKNTPPGRHYGTGSFFSLKGRHYVLTCEHVAKGRRLGRLALTKFGASNAQKLVGDFGAAPLKIDAAALALHPDSWTSPPHQAKAAPLKLFDTSHHPVDEEVLYIYGFSGSDAIVSFGSHLKRGVGLFTHECEFNEAIKEEESEADPQYHFCVDFNPEKSVLIDGDQSPLSAPDGMSGSLVWNTRFVEVTQQGGDWQPEDARITGMVWGHSSKVCALIATRIEHIRYALSL